jgi:hypothetical protein
MDQDATSSGRRILGRGSRFDRIVWFLVFCVVSLVTFGWSALVIAFVIASREPIMALTVIPFVLVWLYAYSRFGLIPERLTLDRDGVEVKFPFKRRRYRFSDIAAVECELVVCFSGPQPVKTVARLQLKEHARPRWPFLVRLRGWGLLPALDDNEMDTFRQLLAAHQIPVADTFGGATEYLKKVLSRCPELGNVEDITRMGTLASIDLVDVATTATKVRESIHSGDWAVASATRDATPGADWLIWHIVEQADGRGAVVEVIHYLELYFNEEASVLRMLTPHDLDRCRRYVTDWTHFTADPLSVFR